MRNIGGEFLRRLKSLQQTEYNNAEPKAIAWITRPTTALTDDRYLDKQLVGVFPGLSASSIAVRRMQVGLDADRVYIAYVADGKARVKYADSIPAMDKHAWIDAPFAADAIDVAIAFDGTIPWLSEGDFVTDSSPWVFWVTDEGAVKGRILGLLGETTFAASNATAVSAVRATGQKGGVDFGLCLFMIIGGDLYCRQLVNNQWSDAVQVSLGPSGVSWVDIAAFRTWDYRIGVQALGSDGKVYELFSQYQGFGKHGSEHISIQRAIKQADLLEIHRIAGKTADEHVKIAAATWDYTPYGGLYQSGAPQIVAAYNYADSNDDWGKIAVFVFDRHLVAAEVAAQPGTFSIVDSRNIPFVATSASLGADGLTVALTFLDFNNANGVCAAKYTPGTITSMAGTSLTTTTFSWTPQNLVPSATPAPEVYSITNAGYSDVGIRRVRFYDTPGTMLMHTEYVSKGDDTEYGTDDVWATAPNTGLSVPGIIENIQNNLDIYLARWKVDFYNYGGVDLLSTVMVKDGEDADPYSSLLIASNVSNILAEALFEKYESGDSTWDGFSLQGSGYSKESDSVHVTTSSWIQYSLETRNRPVTIYALAKQDAAVSADLMLMCVPYANSSGNLPAFFTRSGVLWTTVYGNDTSTGLSSTVWHVITLALTSSRVDYYVDGTSYSYKGYTNSGTYATFGAGLNGDYHQMAAGFKYLAIVDGTEDSATIIANQQNILSHYS